ncbi:ubiquitin carboxyl-terminal hydrolase calypso isoform X1 [Bombus vosnesenskii]|uniref:Ubiquitin carboxyl-terminal hydrolase n=4 Tax=Pyrobombus TaxID=144703 RepID=A0A6J3LGU5_9HYME|nr:ubiquitin carboxyl-terminal hydrolase calypso isoform X1 [Bombus impatiens]XP_033198878.1 ubiquitin carboxyl-terminal hydrolase calypso isoform X1 [Bombus vancouverensis nearcticus]XP_033313414.1 ubiquitin carboxyl-terminal hydrolase calypso isoform X1 [Bombus bifarius]XP_033364607.1 ubiquitin carboxyl-terminal hydrolase calypso isoform X1 [Bombus vosnesenskii]XP_050470619.1 ubiquitin carboxyl-terminal hydrolase calypso isoform X1 [Bombus huntii]
MPVDINRLTEGWLELESDPGLFTLLLEDFGVKGVQVEEIYDLQKSLEGPVYGFIFLFRWIEERRSRRKVVEQDESFVKDEEIVNNIFFAQQVVPNSCATHALLSVLLNCPNIHLGTTLSRLKMHTSGMCPENKGWAIGNTPELACAHNSHAMPQAKRRQDKNTGVSTGRFTGEAFHFVSYVPINGRLFELDGLKPYPMDHGPWKEHEEWTEQFRRVITDRLGMATGEQLQDIRFNLMAVVPDRRLAISHKLTMLKTNRQIVLEALQQLVKLSHQDGTEKNSNDTEKSDKSYEKKNKPEEENGLSNKSEIDETTSAPAITVERSSDSTIDTEEPASSITSGKTESNGMEKVVMCALDYATPLRIQTSPAHSSSSTDTSSEIGSAFNSPTQAWGWNSGQSSPTSTKDFKKFVVIRVSGDEKNEAGLIGRSLGNININGKRLVSDSGHLHKKVCLSGEVRIPHARVKTSNGDTVTEEKKVEKIDPKLCTKYPELFEPHTFAPKDLLALLKNLEHEISICETSLKDENDKRNKYKIDDCRRTHNYDEFICTFLSMLAQQGKLAELVQQHLTLKKHTSVSVNRVHRSSKKTDTRPNSSRRRRGRTKCKKRK